MRDRWRTAFAPARGGVAGIAMTGGDFADASARDYSPERAAQLSCCNAAGFRHFRNGSEPILSRPDQDQA